MDRLALLAGQGKDGMASELGQTAAQLRLKNYDQRNREENRETANEPADHDQIQQRRDAGKSQKNNRQRGQDFGPARAAKVKTAVVNHDTQQDETDYAPPASEPVLKNFLQHRHTA